MQVIGVQECPSKSVGFRNEHLKNTYFGSSLSFSVMKDLMGKALNQASVATRWPIKNIRISL